jgi:hypothetical protein
MKPFVPIPLWIGDYPWDGLMANRNAFILPCFFVMIAIEVYRHSSIPLLPLWVNNLFWFLIPFFVYFNASRAGWFVGGIVVLCIFLRRPIISARNILPFLFLGALTCFPLIYYFGIHNPKQMWQLKKITYLIEHKEANSRGDRKRVTDLKDGLELYKSSNPVLGAGLGSYNEYQSYRDDPFDYLLDSTPLWLLVETGLLGIFVFSAFFILCLWIFYQRGFGEESSPFHRSLFFFILVFAAISLLHEITYTRFLWFALGLALVQPKTAKI